MVLELSDESMNNSNPAYSFPDSVKPGTSSGNNKVPVNKDRLVTIHRPMTIEERMERHIHDAEAAKVKIFPPPGKVADVMNSNNFEFIAMIDQDYSLVGSHVDEATQAKVVRGSMLIFANFSQKKKCQWTMRVVGWN